MSVTAAQRAARQAKGLCIRCGKPAPDADLCPPHLENQRERNRRHMAERRAVLGRPSRTPPPLVPVIDHDPGDEHREPKPAPRKPWQPAAWRTA